MTPSPLGFFALALHPPFLVSGLGLWGKHVGLDLPLLRKFFVVTREGGESPSMVLLRSNLGLSWEGCAVGDLGDAASRPPPLLVPKGSSDRL